jgi:hypothetical protein
MPYALQNVAVSLTVKYLQTFLFEGICRIIIIFSTWHCELWESLPLQIGLYISVFRKLRDDSLFLPLGFFDTFHCKLPSFIFHCYSYCENCTSGCMGSSHWATPGSTPLPLLSLRASSFFQLNLPEDDIFNVR